MQCAATSAAAENLDVETQSKLNIGSLNLEQNEWLKVLHQMASPSSTLVFGRSDINQKCCMMAEKAREDKVD